MDKIDLETEFPEIIDARAYLKHKNYSSAIEVYIDLLNKVEEDTEEFSHILLEYALSLIENVIYRSEMNYKKLLQYRQPVDEEGIEEDLENAWECLETCRINFESLNDGEKLSETHKGLGDIQCLKNCFEDGKAEYHKALDYCDNDFSSIQILECIADSCKNMKKYDEAIDFYKQVVELYNKLDMKDDAEECLRLIDGIMMLHTTTEDQSESEPSESDDAQPVNVNHLKR